MQHRPLAHSRGYLPQADRISQAGKALDAHGEAEIPRDPEGEADGVLTRLVVLNKARAADEDRGAIHWLRPGFQVPRLDAPNQGTGEQVEAVLVVADGTTGKPSFPADDMVKTAVVMAALMGAAAPLDATSMALGFRKARRLEKRVEAVLAALSRLGFATRTDGGALLCVSAGS